MITPFGMGSSQDLSDLSFMHLAAPHTQSEQLAFLCSYSLLLSGYMTPI